MSENVEQRAAGTRGRLSAVPTGYLRQPRPTPAATILDRKALLARVGNDYELLRELAGIFLEDCPRCVEEIRASIQHRDTPRLKLHAHLLAGTASNFGAHTLTAVARRLELLGKTAELKDAADVYEELVIAADELMPALRGLLR